MIADLDASAGRRHERPRQTALAVLASRPAWLLAAVITVVALGIGSVHPAQPSSSGLAVISLNLFQCTDRGEVGESFFAKAALTDPVRCGYSEIAGQFG